MFFDSLVAICLALLCLLWASPGEGSQCSSGGFLCISGTVCDNDDFTFILLAGPKGLGLTFCRGVHSVSETPTLPVEYVLSLALEMPSDL